MQSPPMEWRLDIIPISTFQMPGLPIQIMYLLLNITTQYICVKGVNMLSSQSSSLTVSLVLNLRKFTSLVLSTLFFKSQLTIGMKVGAALVFAGTSWYTLDGKSKISNKRTSSKSTALNLGSLNGRNDINKNSKNRQRRRNANNVENKNHR